MFFCEQSSGLIAGGVDLLLIETSQDILEVKATILGIQKAFQESSVYLPVQVQISLDTTGRMLLGTDISAVLAILEGLPIDVIGMNCSTGPDYMREPIRYLSENSTLPISCIPNAGLPLNVDGKAIYPMEPDAFASTLTEFVEKYHINVVGGCCGTRPEHMQRLVEKVKELPVFPRPEFVSPRLASAIQSIPMQQEPPPFLIGERLNTQGSKKFKQLMLAEDFDSAVTIARDQINNGAHALDISVALTERTDEAILICRLIKKLAPGIRVPFVIDTTELEVMETALQTAPGRSLINSTNLEGGRSKADKVFDLAKKYNAAVIVLTIDEEGMAKTTTRKLEIAHRIYDIAVNDHGLQPGDLVFDALTFTLGTGVPEYNYSALDTMNAIRQIKVEMPGVLTSLGISNVSFGLTPVARSAINSIMLYHCVQFGLDMAIVNPAQITPYVDIPQAEKDLVEDLIFYRRPDALQRLIEHFENNSGTVKEKTDSRQALLQTMDARQRLNWRILHRYKDDIEKDIDELLKGLSRPQQNEIAISILNSVLLPAMKEVGDKFGTGELILPFVLQSAEAMKKAVLYLENFLDHKEGTSKGTIILATVNGDVHDIGKNLVKTILDNNGYTVIDLGKQAPAETVISKAAEINADAIGLSALLVSTSKQMPLIINELHRRKLNIPVLIGGAAINQHFGRRILLTDQNEFFAPGVFYCKDAFEALSTMDSLANPDSRAQILQKVQQEAEMELGKTKPDIVISPGFSNQVLVTPVENIPSAPSWGPRVVNKMSLDSVFQHLVKKELFRLSWGAKHTQGKEWLELEKDFEIRLEQMRKSAILENWIEPQGVYGYWPAQADKNDLILYDPATLNTEKPVELMRFTFPRQSKGEFLCLADYFSTIESKRMDIVAFQVVTVGKQATKRFDLIQEAENYSEAYYTHGFSVQMAEATADFLHSYIRQELKIPLDQGKRYSWGFPAIPNIEDHKKVFQLLPVEKELDMSLTSAFQLVPEQSTAAIIVHNAHAKYFDVGETRINQLLKAKDQ